MAEVQDRAHGSDSSPLKLPSFISNLFPFLQPKPPPATIDVNVPKKSTADAGDKDPQNSTYETVSFPYNPPKSAESLKFEAEPNSGRTSNSVVLWQVYALGGFLVLKWAWARWNERNERSGKKETTGEDDQPSQREDDDNDDDQSSDGHED